MYLCPVRVLEVVKQYRYVAPLTPQSVLQESTTPLFDPSVQGFLFLVGVGVEVGLFVVTRSLVFV